MTKKFFIENIPTDQKSNEKLTSQFCISTGDYRLQHSHADYWEFSLVTDGILENHVNGELRTYTSGTLFYSTTRDIHYLTTRDKNSTRYINFPVKEQTVLQMTVPFSDDVIEKLYKNDRSFTIDADTVSEIERELHLLNLLPPDKWEKTNDVLLGRIMFFLQTAINSMRDDEPENDPVWVQTLNKMKLSEEFLVYTVEDLCRELHYSRAQLNRLFNARYKMSPHAYLLSNRLLYAQNLLNKTDMSIAKISNAVGYANLAQFHAAFKNKFGITPGQYRAELHKKSTEYTPNS